MLRLRYVCYVWGDSVICFCKNKQLEIIRIIFCIFVWDHLSIIEFTEVQEPWRILGPDAGHTTCISDK